ncbi:MAG: hypothetical protein JWQ02_1959 [Capsulimonas sp.]|nr:hypothetical protein [Capsulimonas sp.]
MAPGGAYGVKGGALDKLGSEVTGYLVATKYLAITKPGKYSLTMHVKMPCGLARTEGLLTAAMAGDDNFSFPTVVEEKDFTFPIVITPLDEQRLSKVAETMRIATIREKDKDLAQAELEGLFSMPEEQAALSWRALAFQPGINTGTLEEELVSLRSAAGIDILFQMLDVPGTKWSHDKTQFHQLYYSLTPALQDHMKTIAGIHHVDVTYLIGGPIVVD